VKIITASLDTARRLDLWLHRRLGAPYGVLLSIGLVIEIVRHGRELAEHVSAGELRHLWPLLLDVALLLHTAGALRERWEKHLVGRGPLV